MSTIELNVKTFPNVKFTKEQALKPLEEAAEVFGAYQKMERTSFQCKDFAKEELLIECADLITATCNLVASLDCKDFSPYMAEVENKNAEKGRYKLGGI